MAAYPLVVLKQPVGKGKPNLKPDVEALQELINANLLESLTELRVDGLYGPKTATAIDAVQREIAGMMRPDGVVDPHGKTLDALNHIRKKRPVHASVMDDIMAAASAMMANLSSMTSNLTVPGKTAPGGAAGPTKAVPGAAAKPTGAQAAAAAAAAKKGEAAAKGGKGTIPEEIVAAAKSADEKYNIPASISIAQWILESGSGKHMPSGSNNPFGIKAGKNQPSVLARTREETKDGKSIYINAKFRKFGSIKEAFEEHGRLLATHPAYANARAHADDPDAFADALTHKYATDSHYGSLLKSIMKSRNLYQYNKATAKGG